jgi:hypothetical protein
MAVARKAVPATRSIAGERIRDSLAQLEVVGEPLDPWQSDMLARALAHLQTGNYALATDVAFRVCRPQLYRTSAALIAFSGGPTVTIAEVRTELQRVLADQVA